MNGTEESGSDSGVRVSGMPAERVQDRTCVLYDERTGDIRHVHTVTTHGDLEPRGGDDVEREARDLVERAGRSLRGVRALQLDGVLPRKRGVAFAVDPKTRSLKERPGPERREGPDRRE